MQLSAKIVEQRRGACPTLRAPMQTGDGLLARLRPVGGMLSPAQLSAVAALARRFGNGLVEVTARGNLQVRGLAAAGVDQFAAEVEAVIAIETGTPIEISPLAGLDPSETADARPIAAAIRNSVPSAGLGPKVTVILDGGGANGLADLSADIRLRAVTAERWTVEIGGRPLGMVKSSEAADVAGALLAMIAQLGEQARGRDINPMLARERLSAFSFDARTDAPLAPTPAVLVPLNNGTLAVRVALPFGAASADDLTKLAAAADTLGIAELRLAPQHDLIAICASEPIARQFQHAAMQLGLIIDTADPRRAISACIGNQGCRSGLLPARKLAASLAHSNADFFDGSFTLHVSGCSKGCAHPRTALLTLVGAEAGMGLILDGAPGSPPTLNLTPDTTPSVIEQLAALWRDERALGESVASCFKRLGTPAVTAAIRQG